MLQLHKVVTFTEGMKLEAIIEEHEKQGFVVAALMNRVIVFRKEPKAMEVVLGKAIAERVLIEFPDRADLETPTILKLARQLLNM